MDPGADEGDLEAPHRGDGGALGVLAELRPDPPGAPGGMVALQLAGDAGQLAGARGDRAPPGARVRGQPLEAMSAVGPPDLADRAIGDRQRGGDPGQRGALLMTAHDLLTERDREAARHRSRLEEPATGVHWSTAAHVTPAYRQRHGFLRVA